MKSFAPDYVLLPQGRNEEFLAAYTAAVTQMYPSLASNPDYTCVVNDRHHARLTALVAEAREHGARVVEVNPAGESLDPAQRKIAPTVVLGASDAMGLLREEIFGPILAIVNYGVAEEAIAYVNDRDRPLALYWFGRDDAARDKVLRATIAGGVTVNDCMWHFLQEDMPFGGVGASGMGAYHGKVGFDTFSKAKPIFFQSRWTGIRQVYPPYGVRFERLLRVLRLIA